MSLDLTIHKKLLRHICLPMTHDSGAYDLSDILATGDPIVNELEIFAAKLAYKLEQAGILPYVDDPLAWVLDKAIPSLKGLTTTSNTNLASQLAGGIRGFDLRIYRDSEGVYRAFHGLQSRDTLETMLNQVAQFMNDTSDPARSRGEIVYINMSHYTGFADEDYPAFGDFVIKILGPWAYSNVGGDVFDRTYTEIINQSKPGGSRVILTTSTDLGKPKYFWPSAYCPPDNERDQNLLVGVYTDTTDVTLAVNTQAEQYANAINSELPFANYMTLTPSKADYINIIGSSLYGALKELANIIRNKYPNDTKAKLVADALDVIADTLEFDHDFITKHEWTTLEELSQKIDTQLPEIIDNNFVALTKKKNLMTMIFCDWWATTSVVDIAIELSNDYAVEWSGNTGIKVGTSELASTEGPSAEMYQGKLHMVYKDHGNDDMWLAVYEPKSGWTSNSKIKDMPGKVDAKTNKSPSVAVFKGLLTVVWKHNSSENIRFATFDGTTWSGGNEITIPSPGETPKTNNSPYTTVFNNQLVLVHKWNDKDDIHFSTYDGKVWSGGKKIQVVDNSKQPYPGTNKRPAVISYRGTLFLLFKGGGSNNLLQCAYDGSVWRGNNDIKSVQTSYTPKSDEGPGLCRYGGFLYMFYKGEDKDNIWMSTYDGSIWNENVELGTVTTIDPKSNRSPWAARVDTAMFLLTKGDKDKLYQSTLAPVKF